MLIPPKTVSHVKCRVNTGCYLEIKLLPVIFQPNLSWQNDLVLGETIAFLKPRKPPFANLPILNPTNHPLIVYRKTNVGIIQQTLVVIPIEI